MTYFTQFALRTRLEQSRKRISARGNLDPIQKALVAADVQIAQQFLLIETIQRLGGTRLRRLARHSTAKAKRLMISEVRNHMTPEHMASFMLRDEHLTHELVERIAAKLADKIAAQSAAVSPVSSSVDALGAARQRGAAYMRSQLDDPANLSLASAAAKTGFSERHINEMRNQGRYYALVAEGSTRGYRYPAWQFDADVRRLESVIKALGHKPLSCWAVHDFLVRPHTDLARSPRECILDTTFPLERITAAVEQRFMDADQGAA